MVALSQPVSEQFGPDADQRDSQGRPGEQPDGLSSSTAKRKLARDETLDPLMTERLNRIGAIERLAEETFGDADLASEWLQTSNLGLGNETPSTGAVLAGWPMADASMRMASR